MLNNILLFIEFDDVYKKDKTKNYKRQNFTNIKISVIEAKKTNAVHNIKILEPYP